MIDDAPDTLTPAQQALVDAAEAIAALTEAEEWRR